MLRCYEALFQQLRYRFCVLVYIAVACLCNSAADGMLSTRSLPSSHSQQLSHTQNAVKGSIEVTRPMSADFVTSKSRELATASTSAVNSPPLSLRTASQIVVEVENDNDSRVPDVVRRRRRRKTKNNRLVTGDKHHRALSS